MGSGSSVSAGSGSLQAMPLEESTPFELASLSKKGFERQTTCSTTASTEDAGEPQFSARSQEGDCGMDTLGEVCWNEEDSTDGEDTDNEHGEDTDNEAWSTPKLVTVMNEEETVSLCLPFLGRACTPSGSPCKQSTRSPKQDFVLSSFTPCSRTSSPKKLLPTPCSTPHSCVSEKWDAASETLIFLDWDDTLNPTTACKRLVTSSREVHYADTSLLAHAAAVSNCLRVASKLGRVVIVTMAQRRWVNDCIAKLMPSIADVLEELKIEVVSARESMTQRIKRCAYNNDRDPSHYLKTQAMERIIKRFYKSASPLNGSECPGRPRSWKNIISIGDSLAERLALQDVVFRRSQRSRSGEWKECRCKTVLLLEEPSLEQLTKEVDMMQNMLIALVSYDGDMHADFQESDLERERPCSL